MVVPRPIDSISSYQFHVKIFDARNALHSIASYGARIFKDLNFLFRDKSPDFSYQENQQK